MKEINNETMSRRTLLKSGIATSVLGTSFFAIGEGLERFSRINERVAEAKSSLDSQTPLPGGWTKEALLEREKVGVDGFKIMGLFLTIGGAIQIFDAALNGDRVIETEE